MLYGIGWVAVKKPRGVAGAGGIVYVGHKRAKAGMRAMIKGHNGLTYADAGVDIDAGNLLVEKIKPAAKATTRPAAAAQHRAKNLSQRGIGAVSARIDRRLRHHRTARDVLVEPFLHFRE